MKGMKKISMLALITTLGLHAVQDFTSTSRCVLYVEQQKIPNIGFAKQQIYAYMKEGFYNDDMRCIAQEIKAYLNTFDPVKAPYAIVFDIDETLLSNWPYNKQNDFAYHHDKIIEWERSAQAPAIKAIKEVYDLAREKGFTLFLISGRRCFLQEKTIENLHKVGIEGWKEVICRPDDLQDVSRVPFKSGARRAIEKQGYIIIANIGDQESDLAGGYALKAFKLPNPMYYIP
jgi:acid phosphatase